MKIAHKVGIAAATVLFLTTSLLSLSQASQARDTLRNQIESGGAGSADEQPAQAAEPAEHLVV
nr:hypothetical protein [Pseudomonas mendocina]